MKIKREIVMTENRFVRISHEVNGKEESLLLLFAEAAEEAGIVLDYRFKKSGLVVHYADENSYKNAVFVFDGLKNLGAYLGGKIYWSYLSYYSIEQITDYFSSLHKFFSLIEDNYELFKEVLFNDKVINHSDSFIGGTSQADYKIYIGALINGKGYKNMTEKANYIEGICMILERLVTKFDLQLWRHEPFKKTADLIRNGLREMLERNYSVVNEQAIKSIQQIIRETTGFDFRLDKQKITLNLYPVEIVLNKRYYVKFLSCLEGGEEAMKEILCKIISNY